MENTGKMLFEDDAPQWYVALGSRWVGPLSAEDVYAKVLGQEISWAHFVWKPGQSEWKRICDVPVFQAAVPAVPTSKPSVKTVPASARKAPPPPKGGEDQRSWFLYYNDTQFGPFSVEEVGRYLRVGKLHGKVHAWKDGMDDWVRLETIEQFSDDVDESKKARELKKTTAPKGGKGPRPEFSGEQRKAPRRPLVAKIFVADHRILTVGVCRDISVGGMQVLTDQIPGEPGARIKLNVSPAGRADAAAGKGAKAIEPFVAEGVIVRVLEDGRGFSFRFERLPESSRRVIEEYIG